MVIQARGLLAEEYRYQHKKIVVAAAAACGASVAV